MSNTTPSDSVSTPLTSSAPPAASQPAADRAYRHVKAGLLDGSYPDGHLLSEGEIAQALEMSRTPVREAFLHLQAEGFLRLYPKRGALVVPITPAEARSLLEARLALESFAIDKLASAPAEQLTGIGAELLEHPACDPTGLSDADMHEADRAFHARIVSAADSPVVTDLYSALRERQLRITATARTHESPRRATVTEQHTRLATALRDGDAAEAKRCLHEHLAHTMRAIGMSEDFPTPGQ
ncbi:MULTISPECIES: GntR family transcriptional regulator [Actinopolyspora]|uniref:DNA-binding transcriptional regulator, GntR family n=1 Tax=Actinopolyspora saharensis TaxID=995062 RepID=A0A1H0ZLY7_9ACTN|nr:GntR family transcriptional regulator [Actinopolyspora saharensis]NHD15699.1 GntR family transcriptional regulator [Actinopolyspora sp. BKK2]NHE75087.1 GntR family transcriptional regulator [Actinopolyspora sp. BKK1]SDQ28508.1 DNA-binding transcriptional regulator, GntR family [Actinopolyspora saharensis]